MTGHLLPNGKPHDIGMPSLEELEILAWANRRKKRPRPGDEEELPPEEVLA